MSLIKYSVKFVNIDSFTTFNCVEKFFNYKSDAITFVEGLLSENDYKLKTDSYDQLTSAFWTDGTKQKKIILGIIDVSLDFETIFKFDKDSLEYLADYNDMY
jgi:hypothetical protein